MNINLLDCIDEEKCLVLASNLREKLKVYQYGCCPNNIDESIWTLQVRQSVKNFLQLQDDDEVSNNIVLLFINIFNEGINNINQNISEDFLTKKKLIFKFSDFMNRVSTLETNIVTINGKLEDIDRRFDEIDSRFDEMDRKFDRRFDEMDNKFHVIMETLGLIYIL